MLLPALQQLVELPEWGQWVAALEANYPFPADAQDRFIQQHTCVGRQRLLALEAVVPFCTRLRMPKLPH